MTEFHYINRATDYYSSVLQWHSAADDDKINACNRKRTLDLLSVRAIADRGLSHLSPLRRCKLDRSVFARWQSMIKQHDTWEPDQHRVYYQAILFHSFWWRQATNVVRQRKLWKTMNDWQSYFRCSHRSIWCVMKLITAQITDNNIMQLGRNYFVCHGQ